MEKIQHQGTALKYITILPDDFTPQKAFPLIVLLHGYGSNMHDLAGLAQSLNSRGYIYVCPNAPILVPIGPAINGFAWTPLPGYRTSDDIRSAEEKLKAFIAEVMREHDAPPGQILLGGFSQGAVMTYQVGLPQPDLIAGLIALSGRIENTEKLEELLPKERTQPIFIAHGKSDAIITVDQARQSKRFLENHGYQPLYHEYQMAHEITGGVLKDLVPWIHQVLPPICF